MNVHIHVHTQNEHFQLSLEQGTAVASLLREKGLLALPCGVGKCGKCLIYAPTKPAPEEIRILGEEKIAQGLRLACYTKAEENLEITVPSRNELEVLTRYSSMEYEFDSLVKRVPVSVDEPTLEDQRPDLQRVMDALSCKEQFMSFAALAKLPFVLREHDRHFAVMEKDCLLGLGTDDSSYGLIVDIGTTTVAVLLINTKTKQIVSALGRQNAQAPYGADVISRIHQEMEWHNNGRQGKNPLQQAICSQINSMLKQLLADNSLQDVDFICFTGNTTMMHMLAGVSCEFISKAPFIPVFMQEKRVHAREFAIESDAVCYMMPSISSYVGADIAASLLAAGAHHPQKPFVLIDLGTNAEIVLSWDNKFLSCSAAAGPCFEGATLSCGMAGQRGAIDKIIPENDGFKVSVIGNAPAQGICGSGVLDALAFLLDKAVVDETGRMDDENVPFAMHIKDDCFYLTDSVFLSQKDVREVQLAKAAVRAGIDVLLMEAGLTFDDISTLYLAGGFGSALRKESATRIGLIPEQLKDKVHVLGNGASFGALRYMTEKGAKESVGSIIEKMRYIELSSHAGFSDSYVENMIFPA